MRGNLNIRVLTLLLCTLALITWISLQVPAKEPGQGSELRIALLPILDSLPFYVAEANGFFDGQGVKVAAIPVASGLERDQLMQSGQIDGMLNEMTTTASFNRKTVQVKILAMSRKAYSDFPLFRILSAPGSGLSTPAHLAGVPIGVSMNTIIEYVTDRLLTGSGLGPEKIVKKSVPVIPERYQLLLQGRLKAATLPDPLAKSALKAGAMPVVDDSAFPQYSVSVLSFSVKAIKGKAEEIRSFLKGWDLAATRINSDPDSCRAVLLKKIRVPKNVQETYAIPRFPRGKVPDAGQWTDVMEWMVKKGLLDGPLPYGDSVTSLFLPKR